MRRIVGIGRAVAVAAVMAALTGALGFAPSVGTAQAPDCSLAPTIRAVSCRLTPETTVEGQLADDAAVQTYRLDVLAPDAVVEVSLNGLAPGSRISILDRAGAVLGQAAATADDPAPRALVALSLPGAYAVQVEGASPASASAYRLQATIRYPGSAAPAVAWPRSLATNMPVLAGERQLLRTPRGGTAQTGVAVARALGAPPEGELEDFTFVSDVQFEEIVGSAALTLRLRYEPEAGGGSGYLLSINPIAGTAALDTFEEGQRRSLVGVVPLPVELKQAEPRRLVVQARGADLVVTLDGQPVLAASDGRYPKGLVAVGVVTWSEPVAVVFDHVLLTTPAR